MISWLSYVLRFKERYDAIAPSFLKDGAYEFNGHALLKATDKKYPRSAPWRCDWGIMFPDGKYFRVKETFYRLKGSTAGLGERVHLSFHYGTAHAELDDRGFPKTDKQADPPPPVADLRIDISGDEKPHIHVSSLEHIYQDRVDGFVIEKADMFTFLEAVREHRTDPTQSLLDLLGIKVLD